MFDSKWKKKLKEFEIRCLAKLWPDGDSSSFLIERLTVLGVRVDIVFPKQNEWVPCDETMKVYFPSVCLCCW